MSHSTRVVAVHELQATILQIAPTVMTPVSQPELLTTGQLLALPDDGKRRWLIRGNLRERERILHHHGHARVVGKFAHLLRTWMEAQPQPLGEVLVGEAGIRLRQNPDTTVGIDVAYISPQTADANPSELGFVDGVPVLAVEILSPSDQQDDITEKVWSYLSAGVKLIWVVDPAFRTVILYRPGAEPELYNVAHALEGGSHMPGLHIPVAEIFSR